MSDGDRPKKQLAKRLTERTRQIFLSSWNPVGPDVPEDEYDFYIGPVVSMLVRHAAETEIAAHLTRVREDRIGLGDSTTDFKVAVLLKQAAAEELA